jgi:hypothetical protein
MHAPARQTNRLSIRTKCLRNGCLRESSESATVSASAQGARRGARGWLTTDRPMSPISFSDLNAWAQLASACAMLSKLQWVVRAPAGISACAATIDSPCVALHVRVGGAPNNPVHGNGVVRVGLVEAVGLNHTLGTRVADERTTPESVRATCW